MAPVILKFIKDKVKLYVKHIVEPNFSNYDLRLDIADQGLEVEVVGFLYAKQLDDTNKMLAENPQLKMTLEATKRVAAEEDVLPTTALNWETLAKNYKIWELRGKSIVEIAQRC